MLESINNDYLLQKVALEGFDMALEGHLVSARVVFDALILLKPEARAAKLGLSLTDLLEFQCNKPYGPQRDFVTDFSAEGDPMLGCFCGLSLFRQGKVAEAKAIWECLLLHEDEAVQALTRTILDNEMGDF